MAGENFNLHAEIGATVSGLEDLAQLVEELGYLRGQMGGELPKSLEGFADRLRDIEGAGRAAAQSVNASSMAAANASGWDVAAEKVGTYIDAMRELAQVHVGNGGYGPTSAAGDAISVDDARELIAVLEAQRLTEESVARSVVNSADQKAAAARKEAEDRKKAAESIANSQRAMQEANDRATAAQKGNAVELAQLEMEQARRAMRSAQGRVGGTANDPIKQAAAYKELEAAQSKYYASKQRYEKAVAAENSKQAALRERQDAEMLAGMQRLEARQKEAVNQEIQDENRRHEARMSHLQKEANAVGYDVGAAAGRGLNYDQMLGEIGEAKGVLASQKAVESFSSSLPRLRYAMYDVANTAGVMTGAITASGAAVLAASGSYESSFTTVERTSGVVGDRAARMRDELIELTRQIPQTFGDVADIASRGAQLGIASDDLAGFTETVAQFVATSDTVTLDQAVESIGRISNLMGDSDYNRIGSAITLVGVNAAATEGQIVKTTQELAPFGASAGLATDEVIALATAVSSLGQPPERARSAFLSLQSVLDKAVGGANDKLPAFAQLLGLSVEETARLWKQDPGEFIAAFADSLGSVEDITGALGDLGLTEKRASQVFQALAANAREHVGEMSVLNQAFLDSAKGYEEGTELGKQYGLIIDDLASKWKIFLNAVTEAGQAVGNTLAPLAKWALDFVTPIIQGFAAIAQSPVGKWAVGVAAGFVALLAVVGGVVGTGALLVATLAAVGSGLKDLNIQSVRAAGSQNLLSAMFRQTAVAAGMSDKAIRGTRAALVSTGWGIAIAALGTLAASFMAAGDAAGDAYDKFFGSATGLSEAVAADTAEYNKAVADGNQTAADSYIVLSDAAGSASPTIDATRQKLEDTAAVLGLLPSAYDSAAGSVDDFTTAIGDNTIAWAKNALMASGEFQKLISDDGFAELWEDLGANFDDVMRIASTSGAEGVQQYFMTLAEQTDNSSNAYATGADLTFQGIGRVFQNFSKYLSGFWSGLVSAFKDTDIPIGLKLSTALTTASFSAAKAAGALDPLNNKLHSISNIAESVANKALILNDAVKRTGGSMQDGGDGADQFGQDLNNLGGAADKAAEKVRTLSDYASDLSDVWGRAFEIRFDGEAILDDITKSWRDIANRINDAYDAMKKYRAELQTLGADRYSLEEGLKVAVDYGDTERAQSIRAQLAEMDIKEAELKKKLAEEQENASTALKGNSDAAIGNRDAIRDLASSYQDQLQALAESGASQETLKKRATELRAEFIRQGTQLGYSREDLEKYAVAFDDVSYAIRNVPRNVTIEFNGNPAETAFREFLAKMKDDASDAGREIGNNLGGGLSGGGMPAVEESTNALSERMRGKFISNMAWWMKSDIGNTLFDGILTGNISAQEAAQALGYDSTNQFIDVFEQIMGVSFPGAVKSKVELADPQARASGKKVGGSAASLFTDEIANKASANALPKSISSKESEVKTAAQSVGNSGGSSFGSALGFAIRTGVSWTFDAILGHGRARQFVKTLTGFESGGYTGNMGASDIAGVVHGREFVFSAPAVRNIGVSNLAYMHEAAKSGRNIARGGGSSGGMVELSPFDRQLLVDIRNAAGITINGSALQRTVGAGAVDSGRRGRG